MITATFFRTGPSLEDDIIGFWIHGHGDAVVCAATSGLGIAIINGIEKFAGISQEEIFFDADIENGGHLVFILKKQQQRDGGAGILLDTMALGICDIAETNPEDCVAKFEPISRSKYAQYFML